MNNIPIELGLRQISWLFSYPEGIGDPPLPIDTMGDKGRDLLDVINDIDLTRLRNEYTRLFINAMPQVPCAPYGSVYLEGSVMGGSTARVAEIYRKYGLVSQDIPDHIAVECEFMAWLLRSSSRIEESFADYLELVDHLSMWAPAFLDDVERYDKSGVFQKAAALARIIIDRVAAEKPALPTN